MRVVHFTMHFTHQRVKYGVSADRFTVDKITHIRAVVSHSRIADLVINYYETRLSSALFWFKLSKKIEEELAASLSKSLRRKISLLKKQTSKSK